MALHAAAASQQTTRPPRRTVRPAAIVEGVLRRGILAAADDVRVRRLVKAHGMRLGGVTPLNFLGNKLWSFRR